MQCSDPPSPVFVDRGEKRMSKLTMTRKLECETGFEGSHFSSL